MTNRSHALAGVIWFTGLLLLASNLALAGPNEGGTLILHANPSLVFTSDIQNYCGMSALDSCSAAVTSVPWDPGTKIVFHAIAAFPPGSQPRLKALSFGIDYDPAKFVMAARGSCADFELPDGTWPAHGTGTSQSWTTGTRTGLLTEVYWFAGYAYSEQEGEDSTSVSLIPHPMQHGVFVDDGFPSEADTIAAYGALGFGRAGSAPCSPVSEIPEPEYVVQAGDDLFVWALHATESDVEVQVNRFGESDKSGMFPVPFVKVITRDGPLGGSTLTIVPVLPNGEIPDSSKHLRSKARTDKALSTLPDQRRQEVDRRLQDLSIDPSELLYCSTSPSGSTEFLHLLSKTIVTQPSPAGRWVIHPFGTEAPEFSADETQAAAATTDGRIVVFGRTGDVIMGTARIPGSVVQLHIDAENQTVSFVHHDETTDESKVLNIATGQITTVIGLPDGLRYYSGDRLRMLLILDNARGLMRLYDYSDPYNPTPLADYSAGTLISTAAVSNDGSMVAIQVLEEGSRSNRAVRLLNASLESLGPPLVIHTRKDGLEFKGGYLFVGTQDYPFPSWVTDMPTHDILVFDLRER